MGYLFLNPGAKLTMWKSLRDQRLESTAPTPLAISAAQPRPTQHICHSERLVFRSVSEEGSEESLVH